MVFDAQWITHKGTITDDNRDYCAIALRGREALYVVADGSTRGHQSGALASAFVTAFAERFIAEPMLGGSEDILAAIEKLSDEFKITYPAGRLSFLVLLDLDDTSVHVFHAGDCRLGRVGSDNRIAWLSRAHTFANAIEDIGDEKLADHEDRHLLTRSFSPGHLCEVEIRHYSLMANDRFVIATDGYWADLNQTQKSDFIENGFVPSTPQRDDIGCLLLSRLTEGSNEEDAEYRGNNNFYLVRH